jgi:recombination protein RecT
MASNGHNGNTKALTVKEQTVDAVAKRVAALERGGELHLPTDYSPQNALKSAWLALQEVTDRNDKPALEVCTRPSIMNALLDMVVQGLNPAKKQGYFIVYGKQLVFQRSYFGSMAVAKRVDDRIADIVAEVVFKGDEFEYEIDRGRKRVVKHKQTLESVDSGEVIGAYCVVYGFDGEEIVTDIMTYAEIQSAWKKSKTKPITDQGTLKPGSTHAQYLREMCKKTVINRTCKPIINSSSDRLLMEAATRSDVVQAEEESEAEIQAQANQGYIDVDPEPAPEEEPPDEAAEAERPEDQKAEGEPDDDLEAIIEGRDEPQQQSFTGTNGPDF